MSDGFHIYPAPPTLNLSLPSPTALIMFVCASSGHKPGIAARLRAVAEDCYARWVESYGEFDGPRNSVISRQSAPDRLEQARTQEIREFLGGLPVHLARSSSSLIPGI